MSSLNNSFSSGLFLTTAEGDQLENIDSVTVNNTQWGYLGAADQGFSTSTSPTYSGLTISGGNVGIGTAGGSADTALHVQDASAGTVSALVSGATVETGTGGGGLNLLTPDNEFNSIRLGSPSNNSSVSIFYKYSNGSLGIKAFDSGSSITISSNNAQAVNFDSSQIANFQSAINMANSSAIQDAGTDAIGFDGSGNIDTGGTLTLGGNLIADAQDISTDTTTGTKIGTSSSQKLGFFGGTPATQQTAAGTLTDNSSGSVDGTIASVSNTGDDSTINNNLADLVDRINSLENTLSNLSLQA